MDKVERIEQLVAEAKILSQNNRDLVDMLHENALARQAVVQELCEYLTYQDIGLLLGTCTSNVGRLRKGPVK